MEDNDPLESFPAELREKYSTYYDLLEIPSDAPRETINQKYKEKIKEYHPDTSDFQYAEEMTFALNEARKVLLNQNERMIYNEVGHGRYHNETLSTNMLANRKTGDLSREETSVYDLINMTKLSDSTGPVWYIAILKSTGFKLTVGVMLLLGGLFSLLLVV